MSKIDHAHIESAVCRLDKFVARAAALQEFLDRVMETQVIAAGPEDGPQSSADGRPPMQPR